MTGPDLVQRKDTKAQRTWGVKTNLINTRIVSVEVVQHITIKTRAIFASSNAKFPRLRVRF